MNKRLLRELKAAQMAADEIVTFAWSSLALELNRCGWDHDEILHLVNDTQTVWNAKLDDDLINDATRYGIDVLGYVGYNEKCKTRYGKRNQASHTKAKKTVAALFSSVITVCRYKYRWTQKDIDMLIHNVVCIWNDYSLSHKNVEVECERITGLSFRYEVQNV